MSACNWKLYNDFIKYQNNLLNIAYLYKLYIILFFDYTYIVFFMR